MKKAYLIGTILFLIIIAGILGYVIMVRIIKPKIHTSLSSFQAGSQISPTGSSNFSPDICPSHGYPQKDEFLTKFNLSASSGNYSVVQGIITLIDSDHWVVQGNSPQQSKGTDVWVQSNTQYIGKQKHAVGDCVTIIFNTVGDASKEGNQQAVVVASQ